MRVLSAIPAPLTASKRFKAPCEQQNPAGQDVSQQKQMIWDAHTSYTSVVDDRTSCSQLFCSSLVADRTSCFQSIYTSSVPRTGMRIYKSSCSLFKGHGSAHKICVLKPVFSLNRSTVYSRRVLTMPEAAAVYSGSSKETFTWLCAARL